MGQLASITTVNAMVVKRLIERDAADELVGC
jgi:hypothetical protein